jgi:hypothetical protein
LCTEIILISFDNDKEVSVITDDFTVHFVDYLTMMLHVAPNDQMIVSNELEWMWKEVVML